MQFVYKPNVLKRILFAATLIMIAGIATAQTGSVSIVFTPSSGKPVSITMAKPLFKFDNPHGYWFINPHTGKHHFHIQPDRGYGSSDAAFVTLDGQDDDFDIYEAASGDSNEAVFQNASY